MRQLLQAIETCLTGTHGLIEILEVNAGFDGAHVVRWCRDCGSVVVDVDCDDRTYPGRVMKMRSSEFIKQGTALLHRLLLHELLVTLRADRAHRLFGRGHGETKLILAAQGKAPISEALAAKARFLGAVIGHLEGAYSNEGVCDWFERPRIQLGGKSPSQILTKGWDPASKEAKLVLELARSISASPAT